MKAAIATICPGGRQRKLLDVVWPTWQTFSERFDLPIVVVEKPPYPEHVFWGKYFLFQLPEFDGFDAILHLDNDILINSESPSPFDSWNPEKIGLVDERAQQTLTDDEVKAYYRFYEIPETRIPNNARIYNMGMFLFSRSHTGYFQKLYEDWQTFVAQLRPGSRVDYLKPIADQPHMSLALENDAMAQQLDGRFNTLWWHWYRQNVSRETRGFLVRAKVGSISRPHLPSPLFTSLFSSQQRLLNRALSEVFFLHMAGSKSPLLLI